MATNKKGYISDYYKRERARVITELGGMCKFCLTTEDLEIHHIKPLNGDRPNGELARLVEWKRNMGNLQLLCNKCHCDVHNMEREEER